MSSPLLQSLQHLVTPTLVTALRGLSEQLFLWLTPFLCCASWGQELGPLALLQRRTHSRSQALCFTDMCLTGSIPPFSTHGATCLNPLFSAACEVGRGVTSPSSQVESCPREVKQLRQNGVESCARVRVLTQATAVALSVSVRWQASSVCCCARLRLTVGSVLSTQGFSFTGVTVSFQDESHFLKNSKTARCRAAMPVLKVSLAENGLGA